MQLIRIFSCFILLAIYTSCRDQSEVKAPWQFPENALVGTELKSDSFARQTLFLLYAVDGVYKDTLWFKPQNKPRWEHLFTISEPEAPNSTQNMTISCPGEEGHIEIHSQHAIVGQSVQMEFSDSTRYTDFFRIIDRRSLPDSSMTARVYQGVDVDMQVLGIHLYPLDTLKAKYSGHIALKFSGLFQSRKNSGFHEIEGYFGAW